MQNSFDIALKNISSKLLITDKSFNIVFINSSAEDFLNINFSECEGKSVDKIFTEKPDNSLELSELATSKTHLKRHITTLFLNNNRKRFDIIIGMYHDQVLTPVKTLFEYDAINITAGLPFIRISPDHGPNEQMLGMNKSNSLSLLRSIQFLDF